MLDGGALFRENPTAERWAVGVEQIAGRWGSGKDTKQWRSIGVVVRNTGACQVPYYQSPVSIKCTDIAEGN